MTVFRRWNGTLWEPIGVPSGVSDIDSSFYDDIQHMVDPDSLDPPLSLIRPGGAGLPLAWDPVSADQTVTGLDLVLDPDDNTRINVLTKGLYAMQLRAFVEVDATVGPVAGVVNITAGNVFGGGGDFDSIDDGADFPFSFPQGEGTWKLKLTANWPAMHLVPNSYVFQVLAWRTDLSTGAITLTQNGATEVLIRRVT